MRRETTTEEISIFSWDATLARKDESKWCFVRYVFLSDTIIFETKNTEGASFLKRLVSNGREGEIRLLSVDYFCASGRTIFARNGRASPRIAYCAPARVHGTENGILGSADEYWKTQREHKGGGRYFKAWLRASITGPNTRRSYFEGFADQFSPWRNCLLLPVMQGGRLWINRARY